MCSYHICFLTSYIFYDGCLYINTLKSVSLEITILSLVISWALFSPVKSKRLHRKQKHRLLTNQRPVTNPDDELRRTKRTIFQALLKKRMKTKRNTVDEGISIDQYYLKTTSRPFINKQGTYSKSNHTGNKILFLCNENFVNFLLIVFTEC